MTTALLILAAWLLGLAALVLFFGPRVDRLWPRPPFEAAEQVANLARRRH